MSCNKEYGKIADNPVNGHLPFHRRHGDLLVLVAVLMVEYAIRSGNLAGNSCRTSRNSYSLRRIPRS